MNKIYKNQKGFSPVEIILVVVAVIFIGVAGWLIYKNHSKSYKVSTAVTTNGSISWVASELKYEKIYYKYPSNWKINDQSFSTGEGGCVKPGSDHVYLTSPSNEQVELITGQDCFGDASSTPFGAIPITAFGQNMYLAFEGGNGDGPAATSPDAACLSKTANPDTAFDFQSKNITSSPDSPPVNSFCYMPYNALTNHSQMNLSAESIKNSKDFNTAKLIFKSLHY